MSSDGQRPAGPASTESLASPAVVKDLLARHNLRPRHTLGQNFIIRPEPVEDAVTAAAVGPEDTVLEIGPGLGTLTRALASRAHRVVAIELDRSFIPVLSETVGPCANVQVTFGDAREQDIKSLLAPATGSNAKAVANLPYYATTELLERLVTSSVAFAAIIVLVQIEAVQRIIAKPGDQGYGPLSLLVEYFYQGSLAARVPRDCFWPQPHVDSALVALHRRPDAPAPSVAEPLFALIRAAFAQRRKTITASLANNRGGIGGLPALPRDTVAQALDACGIKPTARAEELALAQFQALLRVIGNQVTHQ